MIGIAVALVSGAAAIQPSGYRIHAVHDAHAVRLGEVVVVGADGGVAVTSLGLDLDLDGVSVGSSLPLVAHDAAAGRRVDVGNLALEAWVRLRGSSEARTATRYAVGVVAHVETGGGAYTWAHAPEELWPGTGADAVVVVRRSLAADGLDLLLQAAVGMHGAAAYRPFPGLYPRIQAAAALDGGVPGARALGFVGEVAASYWDTSPIDLAALTRLDPAGDLRLRAGVVVPVSSWLGVDPTRGAPGVRDATLVLDLTLAP